MIVTNGGLTAETRVRVERNKQVLVSDAQGTKDCSSKGKFGLEA